MATVLDGWVRGDPAWLHSWAARRTITGLSASRVTLSTVDGPRNNRAQGPCSREARMIRSASYLRATLRIAPAGVPSSTTQVAATPACFARFMAGSISFSASPRSASVTHGSEAGPKGITLGKIAWHRTSVAWVCGVGLEQGAGHDVWHDDGRYGGDQCLSRAADQLHLVEPAERNGWG